MSEELQRTPEITPAELEQIREAPLTVDQVITRVSLIREVRAKVMKRNVHFGLIPGTKKDCLFKPGAEILGVTFRLVAEFSQKFTELENGHREYENLCTLRTQSGAFAGQARGLCTTMETKYRYRGAPSAYESTGYGVPSKYWELKKRGDLKAAKDLIGGEGFAARKTDDGWEICKV